MKIMSGTVNWGIDLGTTNSAIARMTPRGTEIVPVKRMNYIPSAVAVDKRGDIKVGVEALNPHLLGARWFKRLMGTANELPVGTQLWSPERLSSEVLKALRAAAKLKTNEEIEDVVITVPAMFSQPQCESTSAAAELAGLNPVALLQEPIAAATAYLSERSEDGHYLVYDLGGGTFDVSLIKLQAKEMYVVEHGGDNYLGGADFDRVIFDWVLDQLDRKGGDVRQFSSEGWQRTQILLACEDARVALSDGDLATIYLDEFELPVAKLEITRPTLEDLVSGLVTRTIEIAKDRLKLAGSSTRSVLLVGGPTQMPYVRRRLQDELGIALSFERDPMTVVAEGAAVHAAAILKRAQPQSAPSPSGVASFFLNYEAVSPEAITTVAGKVTDPEDVQGEVHISALDGSWESGWRSLSNGAFLMDVSLGKNAITEFIIKLRDAQGRLIDCLPSTFAIRSGVRTAQPVTPYNFGIVRQGGKMGVIVKAGEPLPASGIEEYQLAKTLLAGSPEEATIYFVEGLSSFADENSRVGWLTLRGTDLPRTLKEGEKIQVRIRMNEARQLKAQVHIPLLDEDYSVELRSQQERPDMEDLQASLDEARTSISQVETHTVEAEQETIMRAQRQMEQIEATLARVENGEVGEAERAQKQLADVKASLRPLNDKYGLVVRHQELIDLIEEAKELCTRFDDKLGFAKLEDSKADADKALRLEREKDLTTILDRVRGIFWEHYGKTRECWEYQIALMRQRAPFAKDALAYFELIKKAEEHLSRGDYEGVRLCAHRAWQLLPETTKNVQRFNDAALR